ncbi:DUF421 domain-containing protein [Scopulibacillus cellulosilyticus]|uniref:DUF421 domain-containing protein n=1 Tax=Scopulibacillus cellulosilyticus TaxID=2665665 RepID=A0ABW2Q0J3_9BACL
MNIYLSVTIELIVGFMGLLILTRLMGRASMAEATPFDFVAVVVLGDFVGGAIYDPKAKLPMIVFAIIIWGILIFIVEFITLKFNVSRGIIESKPALVVGNGVINRKEMKKNKLDFNRLQMMLREKNVFSFREVEYAILEPNGKVSVIKKPMYDNVKRKDLDMPVKSATLPSVVISDGVVIKKNLDQIGRTQEWLRTELKNRNINKIRDVLLAEWCEEDGLFVQIGGKD